MYGRVVMVEGELVGRGPFRLPRRRPRSQRQATKASAIAKRARGLVERLKAEGKG
jgi:hypothetical protein